MDTMVVRLKPFSVYVCAGMYVLSFTVPLLFSATQLVTGSIVNALLFVSARRMTKYALLPVIILPSLGAIAHGVLFGPQSVFLIYFLPIIWAGNAVLISLFQAFHGLPYWTRIILPAIIKYILLSLVARLYYRVGVVPAVFVASMGYMQLVTAVIGGAGAYGLAY